MSFYDDMAAVADGLLKEFGQEAVHRVIAAPPDDPEKPWEGTGGGTPTDHPITAAVFDYTLRNRDGTPDNVQNGDKWILVSPVGVTTAPQPPSKERKDYILLGGLQHEIVEVEILAPAGTPVLYEIQARGGKAA